MAGLSPDFPGSSDPLEMSRATLYLPTRRACRLARDVFLNTPDGNAAILPRIVALGDLDEDEIIFAEAATGALAEDALESRRQSVRWSDGLCWRNLLRTGPTVFAPEKAHR